MNKVVRFALSDKAATAALGINVTNADINAKVEAGAVGLALLGCSNVGGVCTDYSGNIYVSDYMENMIFKIDEGGRISRFAGVGGDGANDGTLQNVAASQAHFNAPMGLACDKSNNIYVADSANNQIRVINSGRVSVLAGSGTAGLVDAALTSANGPLDAQFNIPMDVCVDAAGIVYVADTGNHAVRKIDAGRVLTMAGNGNPGDKENVQALGKNTAYFRGPKAVAVDPEGNIYVCDTDNYKIKKITKNGCIYLHSGSGVSGRSLGDLAPGSNKINNAGDNNAYTCEYVALSYSDVDRSGNLYVVDQDAGGDGTRLLLVDYDGIPSVICDFNGSDGDRSIAVAVSPSQKLFVTISDASEEFSSSSED